MRRNKHWLQHASACFAASKAPSGSDTSSTLAPFSPAPAGALTAGKTVDLPATPVRANARKTSQGSGSHSGSEPVSCDAPQPPAGHSSSSLQHVSGQQSTPLPLPVSLMPGAAPLDALTAALSGVSARSAEHGVMQAAHLAMPASISSADGTMARSAAAAMAQPSTATPSAYCMPSVSERATRAGTGAGAQHSTPSWYTEEAHAEGNARAESSGAREGDDCSASEPTDAWTSQVCCSHPVLLECTVV